MEFRKILSRIPVGFEPRQNQPIGRNPGVGMTGQVLIHPSHVCQIGESDQGDLRMMAPRPKKRRRAMLDLAYRDSLLSLA